MTYVKCRGYGEHDKLFDAGFLRCQLAFDGLVAIAITVLGDTLMQTMYEQRNVHTYKHPPGLCVVRTQSVWVDRKRGHGDSIYASWEVCIT